MKTFVATTFLVRELEKEGFEIPKNCVDLQLDMPSNEAFIIHYRVLIEPQDLIKFGRALARVAEATGKTYRLENFNGPS